MLMLMLGQQLSGVNAVIFYTPKIFSYTGSSLPDRLGRRLLLNISASAMMVSTAGLGAFFFIKLNLHNEALADKIEFLPLASLSAFIFFFSIGFGPIPWLMMSELFSKDVKGAASSAACIFNWLLAFAVTKFFTNISALVTIAVCFWIFSGILGVIFLYCLFFVPETKGKSLEEIEAMFRGSDEQDDTEPIVEEEVY